MTVISRRCQRLVRAASATATLSLLLSSAAALQFAPAADAAAATTATAAASKSLAATSLSTEQASLQAHRTGKDVQAGAATTDTTTVTAHPNGTFTLTQSLAAVRKQVDGTWKSLDPTLVRNADGSISTKVTSSDLTLSGGGNSPLATMNSQGRQLAVSLPMTLPTPTLSGATATYHNVLKGVDLTVTATAQGSFSEVLVVKNAAAAANPALRTLALSTRTRGVTLTSDAAGNLTAKDPQGQPVFTAPAATMWDSSTAASAPAAKSGKSAAARRSVLDPITGQLVDAASGLPVASSTSSPGEGAHTSRMGVRVAGGKIDLTPDATLLSGTEPVFPVYIDPTFNAPSASSPLQAWTQINSYYASSSYWKSSDLLRVGDQDWESPTFTARSYVQIGVPTALYGAQDIISSQLNITEEWSPNCTASGVQLWQSNPISSSTTWNSPSTLTSQVGPTQTVAYGYDSSCPAHGVGFDISSIMGSAASGKWSNITFGIRAANESDPNGWKEFANTLSVSTTYDHAPNTPSDLSTSPSTNCTGNDIVGDGEMSLYAELSDPDKGDLGATFTVTRNSDGKVVATSNSSDLTANSGSSVDYQLSQANLEAWSGKTTTAPGAATEFTWKVQATDFKLASGTTSGCTFTFDPTRPGTPITEDANGIELSDYGNTNPATGLPYPTTLGTMRSPVQVTFSESGGTAPASYVYQLNGGAPKSVSAANGVATASITPTRLTNTLSVTAISAGANYGGTENVIFNSAVGTTSQANGDLTGDNVPDLLTVGDQNSLPPGLWLSAGQAGVGHTTGDGNLVGSMTDLGINGSGIDTTGPTGLGSPSDYNGATAFSGQFTGSGLNDLLVYYPSGTHAGVAEVLNGNGDGSALTIAGSSTTTNALYDPFEASTPNNPVQLANAGCTSEASAAGQATTCALPDLIGTSDDETGNKTDALTLYPSLGSIADFGRTQLSNLSPDGTNDWASWTLTTMQLPVSGRGASTAMFLWDKATGALDLWEGLALSTDTNGSPDLLYTSFPVATGWNTNATLSLQAADINGNGTPDLWATTSGGTTTAYLFSALSTTGAATVTTTSNALAADSHSWPLTDAASGNTSSTGTPAADASGSLTLTGNSGATWHTGDLFSPDVSLNGTNGVLTTSSPAITTSKSFSVSAWVKPAAMNGGVVLSQDGTYGSGFLVWPTTAGWNFCMETGDAAGYSYNCAVAGTAQIGSWSHVTITYDPTSTYMSLYVNGIEVANATHIAVTGYTNGFQIGDQLFKGTHSSYFDGQVAEVETWNQTLTPSQVAALSNTTGSFVFPSDNTLYPSGSQWTSGANSMTFNQGLMSVSVAGTPLYQVGTANQANAVLTLQSDGNLVAYPNTADATAHTAALWATNTSGLPGDTLVLQPDGNLVVYGANGAVYWYSGTSYAGADQWQLTSALGGGDTAGSNSAAPSSTVTWGANHKGVAATAAVFDGTDSVIKAAAPAVNSSQSYTVSCWVKITSLTGSQIALAQGTDTHQAFYLGYNSGNGGWIFQTTTTDTASTSFPTAESPATANTWTHLTGVYTAGTGAMQLYVNGVLKASSTNTTPQFNTAGALYIGANSLVGSTTLYDQVSGSISDVRTYQAALSAAQVADIYNNS